MNGEQRASVGLGLARYLGSLVAPLPRDVDHLKLRSDAGLVDGFDNQAENHAGPAAGAPRHDQLCRAAGEIGRVRRRGENRAEAQEGRCCQVLNSPHDELPDC